MAEIVRRTLHYIRLTGLLRRLKREPTTATLLRLVLFSLENGESLPLEKPQLRASLVRLAPWQIDRADCLTSLTRQYEQYLLSHPTESTFDEWQAWLTTCRHHSLAIDLRDPVVTKAISLALRHQTLANLSSDDRSYLLSFFMRAYGEVLAAADIGAQRHLIPLLLEFSAIAHVLPNESSTAVLQHWAAGFQVRSRALASIDSTEALQCPVRGAGSPNGIVVTTFFAAGSVTPASICVAGTTPDEKLNEQFFNIVFAMALACTNEPTFVTSGGSILTLGDADLTTGPFAEPLLTAVIGPGGPVEPKFGVPSAGIGATESLLLASETFSQLQEGSGLVKVSSRPQHDAGQFDASIVTALRASARTGSRIIPTLTDGTEPSTSVHLTPLVYRDADGAVEQVSIEIPYRAVGGLELFKLLRAARSAYMRQLIEEGRRRRAMAWQVHNQHRRLHDHWLQLSEGEKVKVTAGQPPYTITGSYDFRRGVVVRLPKPKTITRREYEDRVRPGIVEQSRQYGEAFEQLCQKLQSLDSPGGHADTLTFKLLLDSMIRRAPLHVGSESVKAQYAEWTTAAAVPVWAAIEDWGAKHGIALTQLASDRVVFNSSLRPDSGTVVIRPWVAVDLADSTVVVNDREGTVEFHPAGKARKLVDLLVPDAAAGITDVTSLRDRFSASIRRWNDVKLPSDMDSAMVPTVNRKVAAVVELDRAKRLLFNGFANEALAHLASVRSVDLAPIYFWGAVASEFKYHSQGLMRSQNQYLTDPEHGKLKVIDQQSRYQLLIQESMDIIRAALMPQTHRTSLALGPGAAEYLAQLRAKDPDFVKAFLDRNSDLWTLEADALSLTHEERQQVESATAAVASLEFLRLARELTNTAARIPGAGGMTTEVRRELEKLLALSDRVSARPIPEGAQVDTLREFLRSE